MLLLIKTKMTSLLLHVHSSWHASFPLFAKHVEFVMNGACWDVGSIDRVKRERDQVIAHASDVVASNTAKHNNNMQSAFNWLGKKQ